MLPDILLTSRSDIAGMSGKLYGRVYTKEVGMVQCTGKKCDVTGRGLETRAGVGGLASFSLPCFVRLVVS